MKEMERWKWVKKMEMGGPVEAHSHWPPTSRITTPTNRSERRRRFALAGGARRTIKKALKIRAKTCPSYLIRLRCHHAAVLLACSISRASVIRARPSLFWTFSFRRTNYLNSKHPRSRTSHAPTRNRNNTKPPSTHIFPPENTGYLFLFFHSPNKSYLEMQRKPFASALTVPSQKRQE